MSLFPALRAAISDMKQGFGSDPIALDIEGKGTDAGFGPGFDPQNIAWYARNGYPKLYEMLGSGGPSWSGQNVTEQTALNHSVVWACTRIISESVAFMPLNMMQQKGELKVAAENHPLYSALKHAPNEEMSSMTYRETSTAHLVMGNCFSQVERRSGTGVAHGLYPLLPGQVQTDREKENKKRLVYVVKDGNSTDKTYTVIPGKPHDILHIRGLGYDGIRGYSVLSMARQSWGSSLSAEKYAAQFYASGGRVPYILKHPLKFKNDEEFKAFREKWNEVYGNPDNFHTAPILEGGLEYQQIGLSPQDAQFLETRNFNIPEICRWFLISPHMVGDLSRATFSNIEHLALQFVKMTLTAWITRWEQDLWRCLLTPEEKTQGYYFKHNVNGLLRGDFQSRMAGYATMLQNGPWNIDEVRDLEDQNPLPNGAGKAHHLQLNMQTIPGTGEPTAIEAATLARAKNPAPKPIGGTQ